MTNSTTNTINQHNLCYMTPTLLLIPRIILLAQYPNCPHQIGDIFHWDAKRKIYTPNLNWEAPTPWCIEFPDKYPALFRRLSWFEHRNPQQLPIYLKDKLKGKIVIKVARWRRSDGCFVSEANKDSNFGGDPNMWLPATEQEYNHYMQSKLQPA